MLYKMINLLVFTSYLKDPLGIISFFSKIVEIGGVIFILLAIIVTPVLIRIKKLNKSWLEIIPSFFPMLGILCTFSGVAYGLKDFQMDDIDASISNLLEGLKTAFYASILGILGLMIFNIIITNKINNIEKLEKSEVESKDLQKMKEISLALEKQIADLATSMNTFKQDILNAIKGDNENSLSTEFSKTRNILQELKDSIGSSRETSLLTQIQKLRDEQNCLMSELKKSMSNLEEITYKNAECSNYNYQELKRLSTYHENGTALLKDINHSTTEIKTQLNENFNHTIRKLDEFSKQLAESNTKALVESIEKVITDFNTQMKELISRLVKENFEELNNSVKQLNTWQIENKKQVQTLIDQFNSITQNIQSTTNNIERITKYSEQLVNDESVLKKLILELKEVMIDDKKFSEISSKLHESVASIHASTKLFNEYLNKSDILLQSTKELIIKLNQIEKIKDMNSEFWKDIEKKLSEGIGIIQAANEMLRDNIRKLDASFYDRLENTFRNLDNLMKAVAEKQLKNKIYN